MAHNIAEDEIGFQVIAAGNMWHGLGTQLPEGERFDSLRVIEGTRCNYEVDTRPLFGYDGRLITQARECYRTDTDVTLGVVGSKWTPLQNIDALSILDGLVGAGEAFYTSAGVLGKGERFWLQCKLPAFMKVGDDVIDQYLLLTNTHGGGASVDVRFTPVRVVCENTLTAAIGINGKKRGANVFRIRHIGDMVKRTELAWDVLGIANKYFIDMQDIMNRMVDKKITPAQEQEMFIKSVKPNVNVTADFKLTGKMQGILDNLAAAGRSDVSMVQYEGTVWHSFNAVTYFVDHMKTYRGISEFEGSIYGSGAIMRQNAMNAATELITVP